MRSIAFFFSLLLSSLAADAFACPAISKVPDFNCDGKVSLVFLGDSLVYGIGDSKNGNKGGYVRRVAKKLPRLSFRSFGKPGAYTSDIIKLVTEEFKEDNSAVKDALLEADYVFLDVGRNDRWLFRSPSDTVKELKLAARSIRRKVKAETGAAPLVVTSVLMLPNRGSQGPFVKELNALILKGSSKAEPADLRFDLVSKRLLSTDQIHPTSIGYDALATVLYTYVTKLLPRKVRALKS